MDSPMQRAYRALCDPDVKKIGWAAGGTYQLVSDLYSIDLSYLVDRTQERWGTRIDGVRIAGPESLRDEDPERVIVIIYSGAHAEINLQIARIGPFFSITAEQLLELPPLPAHGQMPSNDSALALRAVRKAFAFSILSLRRRENFAIYGAGELGRLVHRLCSARGLAPSVFLDDVAAGSEIEGIPVAGVVEGMQQHQPEIVLLASLTNQQSLRDPGTRSAEQIADSILDTSGTRPKRIRARPRSASEVHNEIDEFALRASQRDPEYARFLAGKSVALVGPAETTIGSRQQEAIDGYDLVVRLNSTAEYLPLAPDLSRDMGARTDVLYFASRFAADMYGDRRNVLESLIERELVRYIVCVDNTYLFQKSPVIARAVDGIHNLIDRHQSRVGCLRSKTTAELLISWLGGYAARTGFIALVDLLSYDISKLYVTGLTFYHRGGHLFREEAPRELYPLRNPTGGISTHNSLREMELMVRIARASGDRLELDAPLRELVAQAESRTGRRSKSDARGGPWLPAP